MAEAAGVYSPFGERPQGGLYGKLVLLTGIRLAVGTALLAATAWPTLGHEPFPRTVEALLFTIVALIYFGSLVGTFLLRTRRHLGWVAHGQIAADVVAATGLVYLTGGAESIFTVLYPLAIVSGAIGLGRRGGALGASASCVAFCLLAWSMQSGIIPPAASELDRVPLAPGRLAVVMAANLPAFILVGALSSFLAEQLQGARSQLQRSETRLEALEAIYSAVVRSIASGILTLGEDGRITYLNPAAEHLTGLSDHSARGQPLSTLLPDLAASILRPRERGRPEVHLRAHDGRERILGYATAPLAGGASGQVILFQDLTELRQMEEAVRRADRLAVVGGMAAGLAHEIRNPLASMCGSIEVLGASRPPSSLSTGRGWSPRRWTCSGRKWPNGASSSWSVPTRRSGCGRTPGSSARCSGTSSATRPTRPSAADGSRSGWRGRPGKGSSKSPTPGRGSRTRTCSASSTPSSPPRSAAPASGLPSCTASSRRTVDTSPSAARWAAAPLSGWCFRSQRFRSRSFLRRRADAWRDSWSSTTNSRCA